MHIISSKECVRFVVYQGNVAYIIYSQCYCNGTWLYACTFWMVLSATNQMIWKSTCILYGWKTVRNYAFSLSFRMLCIFSFFFVIFYPVFIHVILIVVKSISMWYTLVVVHYVCRLLMSSSFIPCLLYVFVIQLLWCWYGCWHWIHNK